MIRQSFLLLLLTLLGFNLLLARSLGQEVLLNGGAELDTGGDGNSPVPSMHWIVDPGTTGEPTPVGFTVVRYGTPGNYFPPLMSPDPAGLGLNFFTGGEHTLHTSAHQDQSLAAFQAIIDAGQMECTLSAQLGSAFDNVTPLPGGHPMVDRCEITAEFMDALSTVLGSITIAPVTATELGNHTGLVQKMTTNWVPVHSSVVRVTITMDRDYGGFCNAYADNVSLVLFPAISSYCFGDATGAACPCGNSGDPGHGCLSSFGLFGGGLLSASGTPSVIADSLCLQASSLPPTTAGLFFQGDQRVNNGLGRFFGDGLRCAGGSVIRLGARLASAGTIRLGACVVGDPSISSFEPILAGAVRYYQVWYRNADPTFCTPSLFNLTNGLSVAWGP
jgi:hypothetical protein